MLFPVPYRLVSKLFYTVLVFSLLSCSKDENEDGENPSGTVTTNEGAPVFLVIDEESIDNGNPPNNFSAEAVNDQLAKPGLRQPLKYFQDNVGKTITLYTGDVGDEGWHALRTIPESWKNAGPTSNGARNFLQAGPGLGSGNDDPEVLLDEIRDVTPLRATALKMLEGKTVIAVVYDSEISTNYSPLQANLMGANLGIVAFDVLSVTRRTDGSSNSLPRVSIRIRNATTVSGGQLNLFQNAPQPSSSSEPNDITPPASVGAPVLVPAD